MTEHVKANTWSGFGISPDQFSWNWECRPAPCTASEWELSKAANGENKMSADNEHLILGCGQAICFSEKGFLFFIVFSGFFRAATVKFLHKGKANS